MDNLYEDESMIEPIEPVAAVTSEEKKVKKPKPVGQPKRVRSEEVLVKAAPKPPITPLAEDIVPIKKDMVLTDLQARNLERLRKTTDDFYLPENMKAAILGQMKSESSYNKDAVGDGGRAFGYLQLRDSRLKFFLENYYKDDKNISGILKKNSDLKKINPMNQKLIAEAFRNDPDNEAKTIKYFMGELNPNNQEMPKYYNIVNVPTNISGMDERRQAQFNRLYNNKDTSVDDWNKFFTLEYTRSGAALSKKKGVSEEQIKNRLEESKTISNNVSRRSFIKNMSGRFFDGLKRAGIYSEENK